MHKLRHSSPADVSIHALLAECDSLNPDSLAVDVGFNPRTPCGVRRLVGIGEPKVTTVSIHALLAECDGSWAGLSIRVYCFNPRTPCGVRLGNQLDLIVLIQFQSTHSLRSATSILERFSPDQRVSIHALLAECDNLREFIFLMKLRFNPRTPCGVRQDMPFSALIIVEFQSTHSLRSATCSPEAIRIQHDVSIHALLAECDTSNEQSSCSQHRFNPRTPCGVRLSQMFQFFIKFRFQSTHSLRSATEPQGIKSHEKTGFNPRTPCGVRPPPNR